MAKSWQEKFDSGGDPQVKIVDKKFADMPIGTTMLNATPKVIDDYVREIPEGVEVSWATLRKDLAAEFDAEMTCPVTTSIFLRIASELALEKYRNGKPLDEITPFWRVIHSKMPIAKKLSCGIEFIKERRIAESLS